MRRNDCRWQFRVKTAVFAVIVVSERQDTSRVLTLFFGNSRFLWKFDGSRSGSCEKLPLLAVSRVLTAKCVAIKIFHSPRWAREKALNFCCILIKVNRGSNKSAKFCKICRKQLARVPHFFLFLLFDELFISAVHSLKFAGRVSAINVRTRIRNHAINAQIRNRCTYHSPVSANASKWQMLWPHLHSV